MKSVLLKTLAISTTAISFAACSGGGGGGGSTAAGDGFGSSTSAQFIDAPVKGLSFTTSSSVTGKTGDLGKFTCTRGEIINFQLKGLKLGQAACGEKIFVHDLFPPAGVSNHSWQQAAAVIQSFATGTAELDLSAVNDSAVDLSSVSYNASTSAFDTALQSVVTAASSSVPGITHKTSAAASTAADSSLADNGAIDASYAGALDSLITDHQGKIVFKASLSSGTKIQGEEWCDSKVEALMEVSKRTVNAKSIYSVKTLKAISYVNASDANQDQTCKTGPNTCLDVATALLPGEKVISGTKFDVASHASISNYDNMTGLNISADVIVSLAATASTAGTTVGGTFYSEMTVANTSSGNFEAYRGQKLKCLYKID